VSKAQCQTEQVCDDVARDVRHQGRKSEPTHSQHLLTVRTRWANRERYEFRLWKPRFYPGRGYLTSIA
jgi:hypothetical protein